MVTISVHVDEQLAEKARRIAADRNTTVDDLVLQYQTQLTSQSQPNDMAVERLSRTILGLRRPLGGKHYQRRDELCNR